MDWLGLRCAISMPRADPGGDIGENHDPETHLIPLVLRAARDKTAPRRKLNVVLENVWQWLVDHRHQLEPILC
jgi:hypothetical protein